MERDTSFVEWVRGRLVALGERPARPIPDELVPPGFRRAAILLPFWRDGASVRTLLTVRTDTVSSHKGQISFPGGRRDEEDTSLVATALRETHEEVGIEPGSVEVVGVLDDAWSVGGYIVTPVVGWIERPPQVVASPGEIARVIEADVETLLRDDLHHVQVMERGGVRFEMHAFDYHGDLIWGMTGAVMAGVLRWMSHGELDLSANSETGLRGWLETRRIA